MSLLATHVRLRLATWRAFDAFVDRGAEAHVASHLATLHQQGEVHAMGEDAILAWAKVERGWYGGTACAVALDVAPGVDARAWVRALVPELLPRMDAPLDFSLHGAHAALRAPLIDAGLGVDAITLLGDVEAASRRLGRVAVPDGVEIRPLREGDVEPAFALRVETFRAEPQFCWFGAHPAFLENERAALEAALEDPTAIELVIRSGDALGHVAARLQRDHPLWGPTAGMSLCLAPGQRGRGLARPIYRALLDAMRERGVRTFKGGTSQPGVMHLGRMMGRPLQGWAMRVGAPFPPAHFDRFYPPDPGPRSGA